MKNLTSKKLDDLNGIINMVDLILLITPSFRYPVRKFTEAGYIKVFKESLIS